MNKDLFPLTTPQNSIWVTEQFYPNTSIGNISGSIHFEEIVNFDLLKKSIYYLVKTNDALRIQLILKEGTPFQFVSDFKPFSINIIDIKNNTELEELSTKIVTEPFCLVNSPLFRFIIYRFPNQTGGCIPIIHHLIGDAWTTSLIVNGIVDFYSKLKKGQDIEEIMAPSYIDFIDKEQDYLNSDKFKTDKAFWNDKFSHIENLAFLSDSSNKNQDTKAMRIPFVLERSTCEKLKDYCKKHRTSSFAIFMSIFSLYISRIANTPNVVIESPILNRSNFKDKHTMGMFISIIPFDIKVDMSLSFCDFLSQIANNQMACFRHQKYPYEFLLKDLRDSQNFTSNLYDVAISYQNAKNNTKNSDISFWTHWNFNGHISNSLEMHIHDLDDDGILHIYYHYQVAKFDASFIKQLHTRFMYILDQILTKDILLKDIKIVSPEEEYQLLYHFNNTKKSFDFSKTIIDYWEEQINLTPSAIAAIQGKDRFTYQHLSCLVNNIVSELDRFSMKNKKIAIIANKSIRVLAGMLAIMKSGNAYIPIDPTYPEERIAYILEDSQCELIIGEEEFIQPFCSYAHLVLNQIPSTAKNISIKNRAKPEDIAYVIYTSGTTGKPKGVEIRHRNCINTLLWRKQFYLFDTSVCVLQMASFSFDSSVEDTFVPLISGSTLVFCTTNKMDMNHIAEQIELHGVNHILAVPSVYKILLKEKAKCLQNFKFITIAGEGFNIQVVKEHFKKLPSVRLINEYGPTENSICSTFYEFTKDSKEVLIGKPIANCHCYVLDNSLNLLPINCTGELYVGGAGVSKGYWNKPELNQEKFVIAPWNKERLYKTGDLVKLHPDGNLEFISRNDGQIKLHGLRIELSEIDSALLAFPSVTDVVTVIKEVGNKKLLVSYITVKKDIAIKDIQLELRKSLPYYMVPEIIVMDYLPLTPNGKIDKKRLPEPILQSNTAYEAPRTITEQIILEVCQEVLDNNNLTINDDLFREGLADSLSILTICSRLFTQDIKIDTQFFYQYPTIKQLTDFIDGQESSLVQKNNIVIPKFRTKVKKVDKHSIYYPFSHTLLTGSTGFLGAHLLYELLINTSSHIYCIVRKKYGVEPLARLQNTVRSYFGQDFYPKFADRITVLNGELSETDLGLSQKDLSILKKKIDVIIHSAAITKHYGNSKTFFKENVLATKNLVHFANEHHILFNHMSTTTISGNALVKSNINGEFSENDFYIGQNYTENIYIKSKFDAEKLIFENEYHGLEANIFRLGNLMPRSDDGVFQTNKYDNAYYTRLMALCKIGYIPKELAKQELEFSPINDVARAVILLLSIPHIKNMVFHLFNSNYILLADFIRVIEKLGISCSLVSYDKFLAEAQKHEDVMKYLVSDFSSNKQLHFLSSLVVKNDLTQQLLKNAGFSWTPITDAYLEQFLIKNKFLNDLKG